MCLYLYVSVLIYIYMSIYIHTFTFGREGEKIKMHCDFSDFFCTFWENKIWLRVKGSCWRCNCVSGQWFSCWLPDLLGEASGFPSIQAHGGICRLAHGAGLLPSASRELHSALGYLFCLQEVLWIYPRRGWGRKDDQLQCIILGSTQQQIQPRCCVLVVASARL